MVLPLGVATVTSKVVRHRVHKPDWARAFQQHGRRNRGSIGWCARCKHWRITHSYLTGYAETALATEYFEGTWSEAFIRYAAHDTVVREKELQARWQTAAPFMT
jgi:hypothetical protein